MSRLPCRCLPALTWNKGCFTTSGCRLSPQMASRPSLWTLWGSSCPGLISSKPASRLCPNQTHFPLSPTPKLLCWISTEANSPVPRPLFQWRKLAIWSWPAAAAPAQVLLCLDTSQCDLLPSNPRVLHRSGHWLIFFLLPLCKKSMTPHQGNTFLPLEPLKGFLSWHGAF